MLELREPIISRHPWTILPIFFAGIVYVLALDANQLGFFHDDGIYAVTAKSLAQGSGYRIISLPGDPYQTKYPPVFSILLSAVWRIDSHFPANAPLFLLPYLVATILYLFIAQQYFIREFSANRLAAVSATALTAFNVRTVTPAVWKSA